MRHSTILSALAWATLLAGYPAVAQDAQAAVSASERKASVDELLDRMRGLPDIGEQFDTGQPVVGFGFQIVDDKVAIARVLEGSAA